MLLRMPLTSEICTTFLLICSAVLLAVLFVTPIQKRQIADDGETQRGSQEEHEGSHKTQNNKKNLYKTQYQEKNKTKYRIQQNIIKININQLNPHTYTSKQYSIQINTSFFFLPNCWITHHSNTDAQSMLETQNRTKKHLIYIYRGKECGEEERQRNRETEANINSLKKVWRSDLE